MAIRVRGTVSAAPIAAVVLYPFVGILLSPIFAAAAMSFSSVSVEILRRRHAKGEISKEEFERIKEDLKKP